jgi:hypothetical protein
MNVGDIPKSSLKGASGTADIGANIQLTKGLDVDISAQGYIGQRQGVAGMLKIKYAFGGFFARQVTQYPAIPVVPDNPALEPAPSLAPDTTGSDISASELKKEDLQQMLAVKTKEAAEHAVAVYSVMADTYKLACGTDPDKVSKIDMKRQEVAHEREKIDDLLQRKDIMNVTVSSVKDMAGSDRAIRLLLAKAYQMSVRVEFKAKKVIYKATVDAKKKWKEEQDKEPDASIIAQNEWVKAGMDKHIFASEQDAKDEFSKK